MLPLFSDARGTSVAMAFVERMAMHRRLPGAIVVCMGRQHDATGLLGRAHTESTRHESTRSPPPLYPM